MVFVVLLFTHIPVFYSWFNLAHSSTSPLRTIGDGQRHKLPSLFALVLTAALILPVLADEYWTRMQTINSAANDPEETDGSIRGRLHFWEVALLMASDHPLTGIRHNAYSHFFNRYDFSGGESGKDRAVHSSRFGVL